MAPFGIFADSEKPLKFVWQDKLAIFLSILSFALSLYTFFDKRSSERVANSYKISADFLKERNVLKDIDDIDTMSSDRFSKLSDLEKSSLEARFFDIIRYAEYIATLSNANYVSVDTLNAGLKCEMFAAYKVKNALSKDARWFYTTTQNLSTFYNDKPWACPELRSDLAKKSIDNKSSQ